MVREDRLQLRPVLRLEEGLERPVGERGERGLGRREDREGPLAAQRLDQTRGLDRRDQGLERAGRDRGLNDRRVGVRGSQRIVVLARGDRGGQRDQDTRQRNSLQSSSVIQQNLRSHRFPVESNQ